MCTVLGLIGEKSYGAVTIDMICQRAEVKKGSFYYFFKSKAALTIAALDHAWEHDVKPELDTIFSSSLPGLQRLENQIDSLTTKTTKMHASCGRIYGCAFFCLGSEVSGLEPDVLAKVQELMARYRRYFESAVRDAQAEGTVQVKDPARAASCLFTLYEGSLTQARINNDPAPLDDLRIALHRLLKAESTAAPSN